MNNIAIIFAGGEGTRMRYKNGPKQFMTVKRKTILQYTLECFENHEEIDEIYLVVKESCIDNAKKICLKAKLKKIRAIVAGGDSAHASIIEGIQSAKQHGAQDDDIVLFHDGVRPIIDKRTISKCIYSVKQHGSGICSLAAYETPAKSKDGKMIDEIIVRSEMYVLQAPQAFLFGNAYELNMRSIKDGFVGKVVDQAELHKKYGKTIHLIEGLRGNVKITVPLDFTYFEYLVISGKYNRIMRGEIV